MSRSPVALINVAACAANCRVLRQRAGKRKMFAVVKADAYGHGLKEVALAIAGEVDGLCIFELPDGAALRRLGYDGPILALNGFGSAAELRQAKQLGLWLALGTSAQVERLAELGAGAPRVFIKVQTGMHRLGLAPAAVDAALAQLTRAGVKELALMHHYADSDQPGGTTAPNAVMAELLERHSLPHTASNSGGLLLQPPRADEEFVRCGIAVYGGTPGSWQTQPAAGFGLQPAMTLRGRVLAIQDVAAGASVGYGSTWTAARPTRIAVVGCGYAHGYPRSATAGTPVCVKGKNYPLAGRVSMEMLTVDIGKDAVRIGAAAELWGQHVAADEVAQRAGTISYELFTSLSRSRRRRPDRLK